jgi:hypothetical protein
MFLIDFSIPLESNANIRCKEGTTDDLLKSHKSESGKILNALDFPLPFSAHPSASVASDLVAWKATFGMVGCNQEYPSSSTRWGLAGTTNAYSRLHIDCDGFSTYIQCKTGSKYWVLFGPPADQDQSMLAAWKTVYDMQDDEGEPFAFMRKAKMRVEAVLLTPGTEL